MRIQFLLSLGVFTLLAPSVVRAQSGGPYDLSWHVIAGGGVTVATGGPYSLGGTIGQPAAAVSTGGGYELASGFWPGVLTLAPAALLTITMVAGEVHIDWPAPLASWVLEGATTLGPVPDWTPIAPAPAGSNYVTPADGELKFFRLRKP